VGVVDEALEAYATVFAVAEHFTLGGFRITILRGVTWREGGHVGGLKGGRARGEGLPEVSGHHGGLLTRQGRDGSGGRSGLAARGTAGVGDEALEARALVTLAILLTAGGEEVAEVGTVEAAAASRHVSGLVGGGLGSGDMGRFCGGRSSSLALDIAERVTDKALLALASVARSATICGLDFLEHKRLAIRPI
jgi:hypothetical protein